MNKKRDLVENPEFFKNPNSPILILVRTYLLSLNHTRRVFGQIRQLKISHNFFISINISANDTPSPSCAYDFVFLCIFMTPVFRIQFIYFTGGSFSSVERVMGAREKSNGKQRISTPWSTHKTYR